jgi:hypothetical protein
MDDKQLAPNSSGLCICGCGRMEHIEKFGSLSSDKPLAGVLSVIACCRHPTCTVHVYPRSPFTKTKGKSGGWPSADNYA